MKLLTLIAICSLAVCPLALAQNAPSGTTGIGTQAVIPLVDPNTSDFNSVSDCAGPGSSFLADNSYSMTLTTAKRVTIGSDDCCCVGDYYETYVNGVLFNTTPDPFDYCPDDTDPWGCTTGTCSPISSGSTTACLPAGTYEVTVKDAGLEGHDAAEIAAELMCPAGFAETFATADVSGCTCAEVQAGVIALVPDEDTFNNHGQYVQTAANTLDSIAVVSEECHSCIVNQFARSVPQGAMVSCDDL